MAIVQTSLSKAAVISSLPTPANADEDLHALTSDQKIIAWLFRFSPRNDNASGQDTLPPPSVHPFEKSRQFLINRTNKSTDDWQTVTNITGISQEEFDKSGTHLPLSAAEIDHFRRNHRETDRLVGRDFLAARSDLPSPLADLYGLYRHRARLDTESTLFVAQATGSTRVARLMADLLAIGAYASGHEYVCHTSKTYSVPCAFDTAELVDRTSAEITHRLAFPIENPSHLLKLTPDEISVLANNIVDRHALSPAEFLEKANLLSESRQDVHRLPADRQLATSVIEGDLPMNKAWVMRLCTAYQNIFPLWNAGLAKLTDADVSSLGSAS